MSRFAPRLSQDQLLNILIQDNIIIEDQEWYLILDDEDEDGKHIGYTEQMFDDLEKIIFDHENRIPRQDFSLLATTQNLGLRTTSTGISYLIVSAGGDWEEPVRYIIYHDGRGLRCYIPNQGNTFNPEYKTAFGSESERTKDYDSDIPLPEILPEFDEVSFNADIEQRIKVR